MTKVIMCAGSEYCVDPDGSVRQRATFCIHAVPGQPLPTEGARNADRLVIINWHELTAKEQDEFGEQIQIYDEVAAKWQLL